MKRKISKIMIILSVIFIFVSVCDMSGVDCAKGVIPLQKSIINSSDYIYGLERGDMSCFQMNHIPLFYVSLILMIIASALLFAKTNKLKSCLHIVISVISSAFVLITRNYVWFMIMLNIYLLLHIWGEGVSRRKIEISINIIAFVICVMNLIQLGKHLNLQFDVVGFETFEMELIRSSNFILYLFITWVMPYTTLLVRDMMTKCRERCAE